MVSPRWNILAVILEEGGRRGGREGRLVSDITDLEFAGLLPSEAEFVKRLREQQRYWLETVISAYLARPEETGGPTTLRSLGRASWGREHRLGTFLNTAPWWPVTA